MGVFLWARNPCTGAQCRSRTRSHGLPHRLILQHTFLSYAPRTTPLAVGDLMLVDPALRPVTASVDGWCTHVLCFTRCTCVQVRSAGVAHLHGAVRGHRGAHSQHRPLRSAPRPPCRRRHSRTGNLISHKLVRRCAALYFYRDGFVFQAHRLLYHST